MILESLDEIKANAGKAQPLDICRGHDEPAPTPTVGATDPCPLQMLAGCKERSTLAATDPVTQFVTLWQRQSPDNRTATVRRLVAALGTDAALNLCAEIDDAVVVAQADKVTVPCLA